MLRQYHKRFLIASFGGFLTFYFLFWTLITVSAITPELMTIDNITVGVVLTIADALSQFPLAFLVEFPLFLLSLTICNILTSCFYLNVTCHALLAVPLSGLILAADEWGGPGIIGDWHEIVRLAAKWFEASLPSGAMGGLTSWVLRPPSSHGKV